MEITEWPASCVKAAKLTESGVKPEELPEA
jgi:hypothetical protein